MNKDKFLKFYEKTPFYDNANSAWEAVQTAFMDLPCPTCGSKPSSVHPLVMAGAMATIRVECSRSYLPMIENLNYSAQRLLQIFPKYFNATLAKQYEFQPERIANKVYANRMGNGDEASGDGWKYRGAGWLMWTGKENQTKYGISTSDYLNIESNAKALAKYFQDRKVIEKCIAQDWKGVRVAVNGGLNGYDEFLNVIKQFLS